MTGLQCVEIFTTDRNRRPGSNDGLDYQRFFSESDLLAVPIGDQPLDRYQVTLEGIRQIDPDSYRMVLYSWA